MKEDREFFLVIALMVVCVTVIALTASNTDIARQAINGLIGVMP